MWSWWKTRLNSPLIGRLRSGQTIRILWALADGGIGRGGANPQAAATPAVLPPAATGRSPPIQAPHLESA